MATYCISDIHGNIEAYHRLLEKIRFSSVDTLYILGDVIDRGPHGIPLLCGIMASSNVRMLLGNHEYMMLEYLLPSTSFRSTSWMHGGSERTLSSFLALEGDQQWEILSFLRALPTHFDITVAGKRYYLVHGFPGSTVRSQVWGRPADVLAENPVPDCTLIIGHTPVVLLETENDAQQETYFKALESSGNHMRFLHSSGGWVDIDCGCGYPVPGAALGCLRLDDMKEFYIQAQGEAE